MKKRNIIVILSIIVLVLLDQITKLIVVNNMALNTGIILINNFLKFYYIRNTGAAFGLFNGNTIFLIVMTGLLLFFLIKELNKKCNNIEILSYILLISGAIGNLIDRVFRNYVVDFISFTLFNREMAIFNVADIFITFGAILFIINMIKYGGKE